MCVVLSTRRISLLLSLLLILAAEASTSIAPSAAVQTDSSLIAPNTATIAATESQGKNPVIQLTSYVKNSITKTIDGCGQLWKNHGHCNDIRKKQKQFREGIKLEYQDRLSSKELEKKLQTVQGGISFEDYIFLQKGKEDRGKLLNLVFLMFGAPRFLPYALMFNPEMLPSTFRAPTIQKVFGPAPAIIEMLLSVEKDIQAENPKFQLFGKKSHERKVKRLNRLRDRTISYFLSNVSGKAGAMQVLEDLDRHLYSNTEFTRAQKRLVDVPSAITKGMANACMGGGFFSKLAPNFLARGRLLGHIKKITDADNFLVGADIDIDTVPRHLLEEVCSERLISHSSPEECKQSLRDWLSMTTIEPNRRLRSGGFFNENLCRTALLAYYGLETTRVTPSLTKFLFQQSTKPPVAHEKERRLGFL